LAVSLVDLQDQAIHERPFDEELDSLAQLVADNDTLKEALRIIPPYAAKEGVKSLENLHAQLKMLQKNNVLPIQEGFMVAVKTYVKNLFITPPEGLVSGDDSASVLSRVNYHLDKGSLENATNELKQLKGPAAQVVGGWVQEAQARLRLDNMLSIFSLHVNRDLNRVLSQLKSDKLHE